MIEKIPNIHYKSFDNFDCNHIVFSKVNIIYGLNGRGKTTFAQFLQTHIETTEKYKHYKIFLYNNEYRHNAIAVNEDNKALASFYVGENVKKLLEKRRGQIDKKKKICTLLETFKEEQKKCEEDLQKLYSTIAKHTKTILKEVQPSKYSTDKSYTKQNIINLIKSKQLSDFKLLSDQEYNDAKKHKESKQYNQIIIPPNPLKDTQIYSKAEQVLKKTIKKETIQRLKDDAFLSQWVEQALKLYRSKPQYENECPLCSQKVTKDFWEKIEKHFNKEYEQLIADISEILKQIDAIMGQLINYKQWIQKTLVSSVLLVEFNNTSMDNARKLIDENIDNLMGELLDLKNMLQEKKGNIDKIDFSINCNLEFHNFKNAKYETLQNLIEAHNKKQNNYQALIIKNISTIQEHFIAEERVELEKLLAKQKKFATQIMKCQRIITKIDTKIRNILTDLQKNNEGLTYLNSSLNAFFDDIKFVHNSDGSYRVQRLNTKGEWFDCIEGLSEGEKTIVSVVYFIEYYYSKKVLLNNATIVCIDDPITSLDSENKTKILGFICKKIKDFEKQQIFFSSHDKDTLDCFQHYFSNPNLEKEKKIKIFFEIKKTKNHSKLEEMDKGKLFRIDTTIKLFDYLQNFVDAENPTEEQIRTAGNQARQLIENIFGIVLIKTNNFTNAWDKLLETLGQTSYYSAMDIHNFSHNNHNNKNYDELQNICRDVLKVLDTFNYAKKLS